MEVSHDIIKGWLPNNYERLQNLNIQVLNDLAADAFKKFLSL